MRELKTKIWEWQVSPLNQWDDTLDIYEYPCTKKELKECIQWIKEAIEEGFETPKDDDDESTIVGYRLELYLCDGYSQDFAEVNIKTMSLPERMDFGSTIPKYIRKQLN